MSSHEPSSIAPAPTPPSQHRLGRAAAFGAVALSLLLAACGSSDGGLGGKVVKDGLGCAVTSVARKTAAPAIKAGMKIPKATKTSDLVKAPAKACSAGSTQYLTIDLEGATAKDGKVFNTTFGTDRPLTVRLGAGQLIAGLDSGLNAMKVGTRRQLLVPASQAYGKDGLKSEGIGKDADLVFVVDLISLTDSPTFCNANTSIPKGKKSGKPTSVKMPLKAPKKTVTTVLTPGTGPKATKKSYVTVDYLGVSCGSGQQFGSSWDDDGAPFTVALPDATPTNEAQPVIPGWNNGMVGQSEGSIVQIDIPFEDAYGVEGRPPDIGPSDPLIFIVKLIKVSSKAPTPTTTTTAPVSSTTVAPSDSTTTAPASTTTEPKATTTTKPKATTTTAPATGS